MRAARRRTLLAKERTFAAWVRTGLAAVAVGFGAARLLDDVEPQWLVLVASITLITAGIMCLGFGFWSFRATLRELASEDVHGMSIRLVGLFTLMLVFAAAVGLVLVLMN